MLKRRLDIKGFKKEVKKEPTDTIEAAIEKEKQEKEKQFKRQEELVNIHIECNQVEFTSALDEVLMNIVKRAQIAGINKSIKDILG